jgi:hypothetical protein
MEIAAGEVDDRAVTFSLKAGAVSEAYSSSAIERVEAGSVNMSRSSSGRQSASSTSRSRVVRVRGASSVPVWVPSALSASRKIRRLWPTRISSPCRSRCEDQIRSPLTQVPFDEPRSVTHQPAGKRSRTTRASLREPRGGV